MESSVVFNIVSGTVYTAPLFFFCSGFLQTLSFLQSDQEESMFTPGRLGRWYARKLLRYMPLNLLALLALVGVMPYMGNGPVWNHFATLTEPCRTKWWANLLWLSNLYPSELDDKCLPWTWFVPCYVQLTLFVPPLLAVYRYAKGAAIGAIYGCIAAAALAGTFALVYAENLGATLVIQPSAHSAGRAD